MTVQEKIGQLNQLFLFPGAPPDKNKGSYEDRVRRGEIGSFLFVTDSKRINELQKIAMTEQRLHIPILFGFDVIHGFDTEFPVPIGVAASWDLSLAEKVQAAAAEEASSAGVHWTFAPMVDIARDPRWGRILEGAGEDPFLGAAMARAQVIGFQGDRVGASHRFLATVKHFAGYGAAEGGRDYDAAYIPEDLLQNVYLPPFKAAVESGAATVMSAYMDLNDVPATGNQHLLQDILRKDWGFKGFVVSDSGAVGDLVTHGFAKDAQDAARRASLAGVNMDMGSETYVDHMKQLVDEKAVSMHQLDDLVRPILVAKYRLGLFEHPYAAATESRHADMLAAHRSLARLAAAEATVLLRNEGNLLPLSKSLKSIAVIGPLADSKIDVNGPWSFTAKTAESVTILEGLRSKLPSTKIEYEPGVQIAKQYKTSYEPMLFPYPKDLWTPGDQSSHAKAAVELASKSDVVVMVLGEQASMDFEYASRSSLALPGEQQQLLEKIVATGKPVVLLLMTTRPLDLSWASDNVPAIMDCFFGGTEMGNAVADLLFGDSSPSGKLPYTWPRNVGQVPIYYAHNLSHKPYDAKDVSSRYWDLLTSPQYVFGYGLTYSSFSFADLKLSSPNVNVDGDESASVVVKNVGSRTGNEVVQLYLHQRYGSASRPVRELKGFERVTLAAGESKTVTFKITREERKYWSSATDSWVVEPSEFDVWIGDSSEASLHDLFNVTN
jgi:beta-glucosidase